MTTPPKPSDEAVEAARLYSTMNYKTGAISEAVQRILWANAKPDCVGYMSVYAITAARILAAALWHEREECRRLREGDADAIRCESCEAPL